MDLNRVTIREVQSAMASKDTGSFGPFKAFLVNFDAPIDFPRKFYYHGCLRQAASGRACAKTVEGLYACPHAVNSGQDGKWTQMYRFDLFLADGSIGPDCPPLRATIFQTAGDLIGMSPSDFSLKPDFEQYAIVHAITTRMHEVEVVVRLKDHLGTVNCTIQSILLLGDEDCQILHSSKYSTPKHATKRSIASPSMYYTPRSKISAPGDQSASSSSTVGKAAPGVNAVKAQLQDLLDSLDSTHIN